MTKQDLIKSYSNRLIGISDGKQVKNETIRIIDELNSLSYKSNSKPLSKEFKSEVLQKVLENIKQPIFIKEAQESEYFLSSVSATMEYLKPAIEIIQNEVETLNNNDNSKQGDSNGNL